MATITYRPKNHIEGAEEAPEVWGCHVAMREDGSFEINVKGKLDFTCCQLRWTRFGALKGCELNPGLNSGMREWPTCYRR